MRGTGIGTSLVLIASGAVLAFAVHLRSTSVDVNTVGVILLVVGIIGLLISFAVLGEPTGWLDGHHHGAEPPDERVTVRDWDSLTR